ncbi:hypothetical protein [Parasitella parasitica]|uniref:Uncharacterized protein n=1 Tax=Parasitella parasitica TaxID=35722 RepID=A0A0B7NT46_9FUNG|nr:hypothetical protein [Parasitella parasitica]
MSSRKTVTEAEVDADLPATEIETFLKRYNRKKDTKSIDHWIKFVEENFQTLKTSSGRDIKRKERATDYQGVNDPIAKVQGKPKSTKEEIRCCTAQMKKIINDRIPKNISKHIQDTLDSTLVEVSDYITGYSVRLLSLILLLKENTFEIEDKSFSLKPITGLAIEDILPRNYEIETTAANVPPPLKRPCLESDTFNKHYKNMFSTDYLQCEMSTLPKLDAYRALRSEASAGQASLVDQELQLEIEAGSIPKAADGLVEMEEEGEIRESADTSRRRLNSLGAVIISMLYDHHGSQIKERHVKDKCSDIQENELRACLTICKLIMPYIPAKKNRYSLPYQLPFVLMANEVLCSSGYSKFKTSLLPLRSPFQLNALKINAPSLCQTVKIGGTLKNILPYQHCEVDKKQEEKKQRVKGSMMPKKRIEEEAARAVLEKRAYLERIQNVKGDLAKARQAHYLLIKYVKDDNTFKENIKDRPVVISKDRYKCMEKVEKMKLDNSVDLEAVAFGGTDNGLVTMSETSRFDMARFKFHLSLHNRFQILDNTEGTTSASDDLEDLDGKKNLSILKTHKIKASQIDHESGAKNLRRNLEKAKKLKRSQDGFTINEIEQKLAIVGAENQDDLKENRKSLKEERFYSLQRRKCLDRFCAAERRYVASQVQRSSILFVGNRGYGVGSSIKGHLKYGATWTPKKHALYITVYETNENNNSQTCLFYYEKLAHPITVIEKEGKKTIKTVNGTFVCSNRRCFTVENGQSHHKFLR